MTQNASDFVDVQLTPAGEEFAGPSGVLRFSNSRFEYTFTKGQTTRVVIPYEWSHVLSKMLFKGQPVFAAAPAAVKPTPTPIVPEVEHAE